MGPCCQPVAHNEGGHWSPQHRHSWAEHNERTGATTNNIPPPTTPCRTRHSLRRIQGHDPILPCNGSETPPFRLQRMFALGIGMHSAGRMVPDLVDFKLSATYHLSSPSTSSQSCVKHIIPDPLALLRIKKHSALRSYRG